METLLIIIWFILGIFNPFAFLVTAYISYLKENKTSRIIASLIFGFVLHILIVAITIPFIVPFGFITAHGGSSKDWQIPAFFSIIDIIFVAAGWITCSIIYQKPIKSWKLLNFDFGKTPSIFNNR
jgi:hypothetical protein